MSCFSNYSLLNQKGRHLSFGCHCRHALQQFRLPMYVCLVNMQDAFAHFPPSCPLCAGNHNFLFPTASPLGHCLSGSPVTIHNSLYLPSLSTPRQTTLCLNCSPVSSLRHCLSPLKLQSWRRIFVQKEKNVIRAAVYYYKCSSLTHGTPMHFAVGVSSFFDQPLVSAPTFCNKKAFNVYFMTVQG